MQEFKTSAGLAEVSVGYLLAGDLGAGPKSPQHGLLKHGRLDDKEDRKLRKCQQVLFAAATATSVAARSPASAVTALDAPESVWTQFVAPSLCRLCLLRTRPQTQTALPFPGCFGEKL